MFVGLVLAKVYGKEIPSPFLFNPHNIIYWPNDERLRYEENIDRRL